jgi:hypothetical protein
MNGASAVHHVTGVPGGSSVDRATPVAVVLRHMRPDVHGPYSRHELVLVVALIGRHGLDTRAAPPPIVHQQRCRVAFNMVIGGGCHRIDDQTVAVLD